ncbi:hypothetical protein KCU65_g197, partial [Aureobasidium melanogenum]
MSIQISADLYQAFASLSSEDLPTDQQARKSYSIKKKDRKLRCTRMTAVALYLCLCLFIFTKRRCKELILPASLRIMIADVPINQKGLSPLAPPLGSASRIRLVLSLPLCSLLFSLLALDACRTSGSAFGIVVCLDGSARLVAKDSYFLFVKVEFKIPRYSALSPWIICNHSRRFERSSLCGYRSCVDHCMINTINLFVWLAFGVIVFIIIRHIDILVGLTVRLAWRCACNRRDTWFSSTGMHLSSASRADAFSRSSLTGLIIRFRIFLSSFCSGVKALCSGVSTGSSSYLVLSLDRTVRISLENSATEMYCRSDSFRSSSSNPSLKKPLFSSSLIEISLFSR